MQAVDHPERARYNRNPKWEVPLELIEWQPSFTQQVITNDFRAFKCRDAMMMPLHCQRTHNSTSQSTGSRAQFG